MWWQFGHFVFWHMSYRRSTIYYNVFNLSRKSHTIKIIQIHYENGGTVKTALRKKCYWIKSISFQKHVYHGFKSICYRISNIFIGLVVYFYELIYSIHAFGKKCFWFNSIFFLVYISRSFVYFGRYNRSLETVIKNLILLVFTLLLVRYIRYQQHFTQKKDLIKSKEIICLKDFIRFKEMMYLN